MAFSIDSLSQIGPGGTSPRMWVYITADTGVVDVDYFLPAIDLIQVYDLVYIVEDTGGTPLVYFSYCAINDGITIDLVDGLTIPSTNLS